MPRQYMTHDQEAFLRSVDADRSRTAGRAQFCRRLVLAGASRLCRLMRSLRRAWVFRVLVAFLAFAAQSAMAQDTIDAGGALGPGVPRHREIIAVRSLPAQFEGCFAEHEEPVAEAHRSVTACESIAGAVEANLQPAWGGCVQPHASAYWVRELSVGAACFAGAVLVLMLHRSGGHKAQCPPPRPVLKVRGAVMPAPTAAASLSAPGDTSPVRAGLTDGPVPRAVELELLARKAYAWRHPEQKSSRVGFVTQQGNVRPRNEDRGFGFVINGRALLIIADGMGGLVGGDIAAELAVKAAAARAIEIYGGAAGKNLDSASVAAISLGAAQRQIMRKVTAHKCRELADGCRTTMIVVVVDSTRNSLGYAYIGDGGGCVRRAAGHVEHFVEPMKAQPGSNAIYGSLGPQLDGEIASGSLAVHPGDLVLAGTDGVFDRVAADDLAAGVAAAIAECGGDLQEAVALIVDDFVNQRDERGFLVDDNASLGVIAVPQPDMELMSPGEVVETEARLRHGQSTHRDPQGDNRVTAAIA